MRRKWCSRVAARLVRRHGWLLLVLAVLNSCASTVHQPLRPVTPVPTPTPQPIRLPADDAPHAVLTEWWYYTGHLTSHDGQQYGFEFVVFQIQRVGAPIFYAAHFAITDHQRRQFHYDQRSWTLAEMPSRFAVGTGGWQMAGEGSIDTLKASMPEYAVDLRVSPVKAPALHGNNGVISFGADGDSYYYSATRLAVEGTMSDHGVRRTVTGIAWKDRQWGNFLTLVGGGWDWFSIQLSDGTDLMLFLLRGALGEVSPAYGTLVNPDGSTESLAPGAARVNVTSHWTSPHTGATYPSGWSIDLPARGMQLQVVPILKDQELDTRASTGQVYWEGEATISGQSQGQKVTGQGYVELTGYARSSVPTGATQ